MGNCYIFNPANGLLKVTLNGVYLGTVYPADPSVGYQPQSIVTLTARHDDGLGYLAISDPNILSVYYPDDPKQQFGPYVVKLCLAGRGVSVCDDIIIYAGRPLESGGPSVETMNTRGFLLDTTCRAASQHGRSMRAKGAPAKTSDGVAAGGLKTSAVTWRARQTPLAQAFANALQQWGKAVPLPRAGSSFSIAVSLFVDVASGVGGASRPVPLLTIHRIDLMTPSGWPDS